MNLLFSGRSKTERDGSEEPNALHSHFISFLHLTSPPPLRSLLFYFYPPSPFSFFHSPPAAFISDTSAGEVEGTSWSQAGYPWQRTTHPSAAGVFRGDPTSFGAGAGSPLRLLSVGNRRGSFFCSITFSESQTQAPPLFNSTPPSVTSAWCRRSLNSGSDLDLWTVTSQRRWRRRQRLNACAHWVRYFQMHLSDQ